jgi:hypothetical protein
LLDYFQLSGQLQKLEWSSSGYPHSFVWKAWALPLQGQQKKAFLVLQLQEPELLLILVQLYRVVRVLVEDSCL